MSTTPFDTDDNDRLHGDFTVGRAASPRALARG